MRQALLWAAAVALGLVAALATTRGDVAVPPTRLGVAAAFAVVAALSALAAWRGEGRKRALATAIALAALGLVAAQDYLRPGVAFSHDLRYHLWAMYSTWRCVLDGDWWPRWDPYLAFGVPLLQFYGPLNYVSGWPFQALGLGPVGALAGVVAAGQIGAAASAWAACRWVGRSHAASLLAAGLLVLGPYRFMDQTFRLALGEFLAMGLVPLLLVAAWKVARGERGAAPWVLGAATAATLLTHVLTILMIVIVAGVPVFAVLLRSWGRARSRRASAATLALCAGLTVGATAAWWLPMIAEQANTSIAEVIPSRGRLARLAAAPQELVTRQEWLRYDIRYRLGGKRDPGTAMPMYFGCVLLALLLLAAATKGDEDGPSPRWFAIPALAALVLATDPGARVLDLAPLAKLQFPWRFLSLATVGAAMAAGLALDRRVADPRLRAALVALSLGAAAVDAVPYLGAPARYEPWEGVAHHVGRRAVPADVAPGTFLRVEELTMPPADGSYRVAKSRVMFTEYMNKDLRAIHGFYRDTPSIAQSEAAGVGLRFAGSRPRVLQPEPFVALRSDGGPFVPAADAAWTIRPERIDVELPEGVRGGDLRFLSGWFDGWQGSVDGGPWRDAEADGGWLVLPVPDGARRVAFRYAITSPWDRPVGLGLSLLSLGVLAGLGWRQRSRSMRSLAP
jgi:hypothetical protein